MNQLQNFGVKPNRTSLNEEFIADIVTLNMVFYISTHVSTTLLLNK